MKNSGLIISSGHDSDELQESAEFERASELRPLTFGESQHGLRLDQALVELVPEFSRSYLQQLIEAGAVTLARGTPCKASMRVKAGEGGVIELRPTAQSQAFKPELMALDIVHEDEHLLVLNKPAGLVVHPAPGNWRGTLLNGLLAHDAKASHLPRAGIVHRLDKDTSGLLVVAKTLTAQTDLVRQMQARSVKRHYLALALGSVERDGTVDAPLGRHAVQRTKMAIVRAGGKEARTHYAVLERFAKATLLECRLETGRTHQIRVHLASIKHPLAGDPAYGKAKSGDARLDAFPRQALHAWRLALVHPVTGAEMAWESPLPADFAQLLEDLRRE